MLQQQVVHGPERALPVSGLGRLGTQGCVRAHVGQRQVSPDVSEVAEVGEQCPYDGLGLAAIGALEVAVASQGLALILLPDMRMVVAHVESADGDTTQAHRQAQDRTCRVGGALRQDRANALP